MRALAVVVVATPCPLILAAPIALVSGLSRAARAGVIVKGAGAIETLGQARTVLFDKTGTLTVGVPEVRDIAPRPGVGEPELLRLAASVDRVSAHPLGEALVRAAGAADLPLTCRRRSARNPARASTGWSTAIPSPLAAARSSGTGRARGGAPRRPCWPARLGRGARAGGARRRWPARS